MTENAGRTGTTPPGPVPPPPPGPSWGPPPAPRPPLRRSTTDRVVGGVCAGLARSLGIDPVVVRVLVAVLALAGGAGVVLYVVGLLAIPEEGAATSEGQRLVDSARTDGNRTWLVVGAVVLAVVLLGGIATPFALGGWHDRGLGGFGLVVVALVVLGVWYASSRRGGPPPGWGGRAPGGPGGPGGPYGPGGPAASAGPTGPATTGPATTGPAPAAGTTPTAPAGGAPAAGAPVDLGKETFTMDTATTPAGGAPGGSAGYGATGYAYGGTGTYPGYSPPLPVPPPRRREPSYLGALTLSAAVLVAGLLGALAVAGVWDMPFVVLLAAVLAVLGAGLVVGAFVGRARWLIALAVPLVLLAQAAAFFPHGVHVDGGVGDRRWVVSDAAAAAAEHRLGVGDGVLDLRSLSVPAGRTVSVSASVGTGQLRVLLPTRLNAVVDARTGLGRVEVEGTERSGRDAALTTTLVAGGRASDATGSGSTGSGSTGSGSDAVNPSAVNPTVGTVVVDAEVGLGNLEVRREAA